MEVYCSKHQHPLRVHYMQHSATVYWCLLKNQYILWSRLESGLWSWSLECGHGHFSISTLNWIYWRFFSHSVQLDAMHLQYTAYNGTY